MITNGFKVDSKLGSTAAHTVKLIEVHMSLMCIIQKKP